MAFGPSRLGHNSPMAEQLPAFFGKMRHHRREGQNQRFGRLAQREAHGAVSGSDFGAPLPRALDKLIDAGDGAVEAQGGEILGDGRKGAVGGAAQVQDASLRLVGASAPTAAPSRATSPTWRQRRWVKRQAPSTPVSVHSMSRSGGVSDSMNQRAVSAP